MSERSIRNWSVGVSLKLAISGIEGVDELEVLSSSGEEDELEVLSSVGEEVVLDVGSGVVSLRGVPQLANSNRGTRRRREQVQRDFFGGGERGVIIVIFLKGRP